MNKCKACGAPLHWITTPGGKNMPCDFVQVWYEPDPNGTKVIITPEGEYVKGEYVKALDATNETKSGYIPHWATCPAAKSFKRRQK